MKNWILVCLTVFLLLIISQWISGYMLLTIHTPGKENMVSKDIFLLFQAIVVGTGLWAISRFRQTRKGVSE